MNLADILITVWELISLTKVFVVTRENAPANVCANRHKQGPYRKVLPLGKSGCPQGDTSPAQCFLHCIDRNRAPNAWCNGARNRFSDLTASHFCSTTQQPLNGCDIHTNLSINALGQVNIKPLRSHKQRLCSKNREGR